MKKFARGYWDEICETLSLPSDEVLDSLDRLDKLDKKSSNYIYANINNSWFESECYYLPSNTVYKAIHKIRLYPDSRQQDILNQWLGTSRYVFNRTLEIISRGNNTDWLEIKRSLLQDLPEWAQKVPSQIKSFAVHDAYMTSRHNNCANFRARRDAKQTLEIPKSSVSNRGIYTHFLGEHPDSRRKLQAHL